MDGKISRVLFLLFLAGVMVLAAFGIDHAVESILVAIVAPLVLVVSIGLGVAVGLKPFWPKDEEEEHAQSKER